MLNERILANYAQLLSPVLSVYVNTSERNANRHPRVRPELGWLSDASDTLARPLDNSERKSFDRQVRRVRRFLQHRRAAERATVIFAGPSCWRIFPLHVSVENILHWGKPEIAPLLPLFCGQRRYGVVVLDHTGVRYFLSSHGEDRWIRRVASRQSRERGQASLPLDTCDPACTVLIICLRNFGKRTSFSRPYDFSENSPTLGFTKCMNSTLPIRIPSDSEPAQNTISAFSIRAWSI